MMRSYRRGGSSGYDTADGYSDGDEHSYQTQTRSSSSYQTYESPQTQTRTSSSYETYASPQSVSFFYPYVIEHWFPLQIVSQTQYKKKIVQDDCLLVKCVNIIYNFI